MIDLTAITTPFGLLDAETQKALKAHGGPWEYFGSGGWTHAVLPYEDAPWFVFRVKPAPPKPREFWLQFRVKGTCPAVYASPVRPDAEGGFVIHVREVLE